jgi:hypothetical protein
VTPAKRDELAALDARVSAFANERGLLSLSRSALASKLGESEDRIRASLARLEKRGAIGKVLGRGRGAIRMAPKASTETGRAAAATTHLGALQRAAMRFPGRGLQDSRRQRLLEAVAAVASWPEAQATLEREGYLADAVMEHLPGGAGLFGPVGAARILAGALVLPAELVEAVTWAVGTRELAAVTLREAAKLAAAKDGSS